MPISAAFYQATLDTLSSVRPIRSKKMFGGAGIYLDEVFFCVLDDDKIFFKVDPETVSAYEHLGMGPWLMAGEPQTNYRELPPSVYAEPEKLGEWMDAAVAAAVRLKKGKKK